MSDDEQLRPLIDVGRNTLPGEVDWWFLSPEHVDGFADDIVQATSLAHRVSLMFIACQWHAEKGRALPPQLLDALAFVLTLGAEIAEQSLDASVLDDELILRSAEGIIASCSATANRRRAAGERRRRSLEAQPLELRETQYRLMRYAAETGVPTPPIVLRSLAHLLGLVSVTSQRLLSSPELLRLAGLPNVDDLATFVAAARLDGEAMQPTHGTSITLDEFSVLATEVYRKIDAGDWARSPEHVATRVESKRRTVRTWRELPSYRRLAKAAAAGPALTASVWNQWRRSGS